MNTFLLRLYAYCFFRELIAIYPFYAVMFVERGLDGSDISILFAVWSGIVILLEVPTGALADRYSRKSLLSLAQVVRAAGFACWLISPTFWGFLVGFLLWGACSAIGSGTFEALVYDELADRGESDTFVRVLGRTRSAASIGMIVSALSVTWLFDLGYTFLLVASVSVCLLTSLVILLLPAAPRAKTVAPDRYLTILRNGTACVSTNRLLLRLLIFAAIAFALPQSLDEYWPVFATEVGVPTSALGVLIAVISALQATGSAIAHRFSFLRLRSTFLVFAFCGLLLVAAGSTDSPVSLGPLLIFVLILSILNVLIDGRLQDAIPGDVRATVSSVKNLATELTGITIFLGMGAVVGDGAFAPGLVTFGVLATLIGLAYRVANLQMPAADPS